LDGKIAIATVTLNRAKSHKFGDTICEVVYDARKDANGQILRHKCQFSWYCDGLKDEPNLANAVERKAWRKAREVAEGVMLGEYYANQLNADTLYYHAVSVKPYWAARKVKVARVGGHIFYRDRFKSRKS
jgi:spore germination cell wall hydrolase CwlJ-like protein